VLEGTASDNKPLPYTRMRELLIWLLRLLSNNIKDFGVHSFRSDSATTAANSGIPDRLFKRNGWWKSEATKDDHIKDDLKRIFSVSQNWGL
jgi:hypothetical protein